MTERRQFDNQDFGDGEPDRARPMPSSPSDVGEAVRSHNESEFESELPEFGNILASLRKGQADSLMPLLERYRNYLLFIAQQEMESGNYPKFGASDVVQETMICSQQKIDQFRGNTEQEFLGWLRAILRNGLRQNVRQWNTDKRNRRREIGIDEQSGIATGLVDPQLTPQTSADKAERSKEVLAALNELSEEQRQVVQLRNFDRLSFREIGERIGKSENMARYLWAQALERLRHLLNDESLDNDESGQ